MYFHFVVYAVPQSRKETFSIYGDEMPFNEVSYPLEIIVERLNFFIVKGVAIRLRVRVQFVQPSVESPVNPNQIIVTKPILRNALDNSARVRFVYSAPVCKSDFAGRG